MKKMLVILCALTLITVSPAQAQTDFTAYCGATPVLSVTYDEGSLRLDTDSYLGSSRGGHQWLGMFYNSAYTVELAADQYRDLPADSSPEQLSAYLCAAMQGDGASPVEIYRGGSLSFAVISLSRPSGSSYYAAALSKGYVVYFEIYNLRGGVDASALSTLKALLNGVK